MATTKKRVRIMSCILSNTTQVTCFRYCFQREGFTATPPRFQCLAVAYSSSDDRKAGQPAGVHAFGRRGRGDCVLMHAHIRV
eukprot:6200779-Pleurochrysis_carterae.AAC.1